MCIHILPFNKKTIFLFVYYMKLYFNSLKSNNFQNCTNRRIFCQWLEYVITYTGTIVQVIINHCFIPLFIMFKHIIQFILQNGKRVLVLKNILYILKEYTQDVFFFIVDRWPIQRGITFSSISNMQMNPVLFILIQKQSKARKMAKKLIYILHSDLFWTNLMGKTALQLDCLNKIITFPT